MNKEWKKLRKLAEREEEDYDYDFSIVIDAIEEEWKNQQEKRLIEERKLAKELEKKGWNTWEEDTGDCRFEELPFKTIILASRKDFGGIDVLVGEYGLELQDAIELQKAVEEWYENITKNS